MTQSTPQTPMSNTNAPKPDMKAGAPVHDADKKAACGTTPGTCDTTKKV